MNPSESMAVDQGTYIQVNGLCMYYETHGAGIPVILLHGGLETCQMWEPVTTAFSRFYQVFTPDTRAHGRTDNPTGQFSFPLMAEDIAQFIQSMGLQKPLVVGYSNGGRIALNMAMAYPGLARGYLFGGIYNSMTDEWRQVMQGVLGFDGPGIVDFERIERTNPELIRSVQEKHGVYHGPDYWKTLLVQASRCWWAMPKHTQADFAKVVDPCLFWCGDRDVFCPPEQSLEMYRMVKGAELAVVPHADHFTMFTQQIDVAIPILLNYMRRLVESK
jgi:pimeloyl-ACP methyl ester carboxylesterase